MLFVELASAPARARSCTLTSEAQPPLSFASTPAFCYLCVRSAVFASRLLQFIDARPVLAIVARYGSKRSAVWPVRLFTLAHCCECALQSCSGRGHGNIVAVPHCCGSQQCHSSPDALAATPRATRPPLQQNFSRNDSNTRLTTLPFADTSKHEARARTHRWHRRRLRRALVGAGEDAARRRTGPGVGRRDRALRFLRPARPFSGCRRGPPCVLPRGRDQARPRCDARVRRISLPGALHVHGH